VGLALAHQLRGQRRVAACFFGDGAVAEGEFHESLNLAALWRLPVLVLCENNLYAMGTALERHQAQLDLTLKAKGYAVAAASVDGMDVLAVEAAARQAAGHVRSGKGPYLLEARTYRFRAHSAYDPELYRAKDEVERWKKRDPISALEARLRQWDLLRREDLDRIEAEVAKEIEEAVAYAEASPWEPVEDLLKDVLAEALPARGATR
jgi:TPP-dependent pyruvate/acetoin dehydrogenase alpha subunit